MKLTSALAVALLFQFSSFAATPSAEQIKSAAENYLAKKSVMGIDRDLSMDDALKTQDAFVKVISEKLGPPAGYKIGLITKPNQERMGATGPVYGTLLKDMLIANHTRMSPQYGLKPAIEMDMGVYVKDDRINDAKTTEEVIPHLSHLVCFIELVDTIADTNQPMNASVLVALNVGARAGVIGMKREMTSALAHALPEMKLIMLDRDGIALADVPKLGLQPLDNIPGLIANLRKQGKALKAGDFISMGSPAAPQPIPAGKSVVLRYENLPGGNMTAGVSFGKQ